ncbi:MAG: 2-C-methyl-D-erythritol 4-phosphate cytidylyltransferase [Erysipelotrichaceae bacterium]
MEYCALIVAAGKGKRMGLGYNKVFFQLNEEQTVLERTISIFETDERCKEIVVVVANSEYQRCLEKYKKGNVVFVSGGETRMNSVYNGLMAVKEDIVLIHDGARPFVSIGTIDRVLDKMDDFQAVIPCVKIKDTVKVVREDIVNTTLVRSELRQIQTPQAFNTDLIIGCYKKAFEQNIDATDDAQVVELCSNEPIYTVEGEYENIKITTLSDLKFRY